jgi:hypothetical protein
MASTRLAEAVGYPGSSVAFAQLLSGMERDGLIAREVRGKRTYRIILAPGVEPGRGRPSGISGNATGGAVAGSGVVGGIATPGNGAVATALATGAIPAMAGMAEQAAARFDYDELARRLLIQVIRRLAAPPEGQEGIVADLQRELAAARSSASSLTAENLALREQLRAARRSLDSVRATLGDDARTAAGAPEPTRSGPVGEELTEAEVVLLDRLVAPARDDGGIQRGANAS